MVILITGVSSGFGLEMAKTLSQKGHTIYGTVRRDVEHIAGVNYLNADVRDEESVIKAVEEVIRREGFIDVLINNAGMGVGGPIEFTSTADAMNQMDVNFFGLVRFVHAVLPYMRKRGSGKIIAMSSIGGLMGLPYQGFYSAGKFAVEGYCESLRLETRKFGIKVVVIEPGDFSTGFTASRKKVGSCSDELAKAYPGYAKSMESIEKDEKGGLTPDVLAKRIAKIVEKKNPAYNYIIATFVQKISVFIKKIVSARTYSKILGAYYKL